MIALSLLLLACSPDAAPDAAKAAAPGDTGASSGAPDTGSSGDTGEPGDTGEADPPAPLSLAFTFAVIADPHVTGATANLDRLDQAVDWIAAEAEPRDIELVFILGDIAWGGGFDLARDSLAGLPVPWVPVQGDNPIQVGDEPGFQATFADQLAAMGATLPGWRLAPSPVPNPERGGESHLHNFAFDHGPVRFIGLDWNSRELDPLWGETPDLHDFDGGTLPFLADELAALDAGPAGRAILLTHMPMFFGPGGYLDDEAAQLIDVLDTHPGAVHHNLCGHLHGNGTHLWEEAGITVLLTDATFDDANTVRVVEVWASADAVVLESELFDVR